MEAPKFSAVNGCTSSTFDSAVVCAVAPGDDEIDPNLDAESSALVFGAKLSNIGAKDAIAFSVAGVGVSSNSSEIVVGSPFSGNDNDNGDIDGKRFLLFDSASLGGTSDLGSESCLFLSAPGIGKE